MAHIITICSVLDKNPIAYWIEKGTRKNAELVATKYVKDVLNDRYTFFIESTEAIPEPKVVEPEPVAKVAKIKVIKKTLGG